VGASRELAVLAGDVGIGRDRPLGRAQPGQGIGRIISAANSRARSALLSKLSGPSSSSLQSSLSLPPVSSHVADFLVPYDLAALKGGADEGTPDPLRVCPQGPLIRRRSDCREVWVICSWVASRGSS
jgi:hypothetical protein